MRPRRFGPKCKFRVDLHGVSVFGPGDQHTLIRWEWVKEIRVEGDLIISSGTADVRFPPGAFGQSPEELFDLLTAARSIEARGGVIGRLCAR